MKISTLLQSPYDKEQKEGGAFNQIVLRCYSQEAF